MKKVCKRIKLCTVFNTLESTDIYTLTSRRLFKFYKMHVQRMVRATELSNQVKLVKTQDTCTHE